MKYGDPRKPRFRGKKGLVRSEGKEYVVQDGDIILLHDLYSSSVDAAVQIVDALQGKGYCFVTVDELLARNGITPQKGEVYRSGRG